MGKKPSRVKFFILLDGIKIAIIFVMMKGLLLGSLSAALRKVFKYRGGSPRHGGRGS